MKRLIRLLPLFITVLLTLFAVCIYILIKKPYDSPPEVMAPPRESARMTPPPPQTNPYTYAFSGYFAGDFAFGLPCKIVRTPSDIYILDHHKGILRFSPDGQYIAQYGTENRYHYFTPGIFDTASDMALDSHGNVYVVSDRYGTIQVFNADGVYMRMIREIPFDNHVGKSNLRTESLAIDKNDDAIYIAMTSHLNVIVKINAEGDIIKKWGGPGSGAGQFQFAGGWFDNRMALDGSGNLYVYDMLNRRIQKFDSEGNFLTEITYSDTRDREFADVRDIAIDNDGNINVLDGFLIRIFSPEGQPLGHWGKSALLSPRDPDAFQGPLAISIDFDGKVFIADGNRIKIFDRVKQ